MDWSRRAFLRQSALLAGTSPLLLSRRTFAAEQPVRGGQLIVAQYPDPTGLTSAITVAGPTQAISGKIFDGLVTLDLDFTIKPVLATAWVVSPDGLTTTFKLRPGVTWHDGKPFTSADVAYSVLEVWKKFHSRGRSTFANVETVDTPDPLTAILRLSKPAPYLVSALVSVESQVLPKHLYEGTDVLSNPHNLAPVGTGPFRFVNWDRGNYIALERNPTYWDQPKPYLDRIIFRILPDSAARATAIETGEAHIVNGISIAYDDIDRLGKLPDIEVLKRSRSYTSGITGFEFNLDKPYFQDVRVRRAFAHAIDRDFIAGKIWYGYAHAATGPIPEALTSFYSGDVPLYPYDLKKAAALLDEAGLKPDANGVRLSITHDPVPVGEAFSRTGEYVRDTLGKIGVKVLVRNQDFGAFLRRVYTDRDFDTIHFPANASPDPAIGTQRLYWSKNFQPGVAFSNGSHYASPEADHLLEAAQIELDPAKRRDFYVKFQQLAQTDLPRIPLVAPLDVTISQKRLRQHSVTADGIYGNFADAYFLPA